VSAVSTHLTFTIPVVYGLMLAAGIATCFWYQRIGWLITLSANMLLITFGLASGMYGFSIAVPLAAAAQVHNLIRSRREPWTTRRIRVIRSRRPRRRVQPIRHDATLIETIPIVEPGRLDATVGYPCPFGCGTFQRLDLVTHLVTKRGNYDHWPVTNR
jgi:hypothetical protein